MHSSIIEVLKTRGLFENGTCEQWPSGLHKVYHGIDPSADCLHLGNLIGLIVLRWFQLMGHTPVVILGGATGMIGDPSGRSKERNLLDRDTLGRNVAEIEKIVRKLLPAQEGLPEPIFLNNYDWFQSIGFLDFLRDVGKHFRLGAMLAKDSVQTRLQGDDGISFTEFCYQTLQAYDFYHLFEHCDVLAQCGGSDQWGNITSGCDLIARKSDRKIAPIGLVWPLLVRSDGRKFGKSEEGAIWLTSDKLSPYKFYQYAFNTTDADVISFMKKLTFMPMEEILRYEEGLMTHRDPPNTAQRRYAEELTRMIHGEEGLRQALAVTQAAKPGANAEFNTEQLQAIVGQIPTVELASDQVIGVKIVDIMAAYGLVESRASAKRLIENHGAYMNQQQVVDSMRVIQESDLLDHTWLVLSAGKKKRLLVKVLNTNHK